VDAGELDVAHAVNSLGFSLDLRNRGIFVTRKLDVHSIQRSWVFWYLSLCWEAYHLDERADQDETEQLLQDASEGPSFLLALLVLFSVRKEALHVLALNLEDSVVHLLELGLLDLLWLLLQFLQLVDELVLPLAVICDVGVLPRLLLFLVGPTSPKTFMLLCADLKAFSCISCCFLSLGNFCSTICLIRSSIEKSV